MISALTEEQIESTIMRHVQAHEFYAVPDLLDHLERLAPRRARRLRKSLAVKLAVYPGSDGVKPA